MSTPPPVTPYIPAEKSVAEITIKAVVLGVLLSMLLSGANAYLGLKAGMTVSASIPAAVISMAVLRLLGRASILENNIVQTSASAGESLAAGVIFTMPALVLLGAWTDFDYFETTMIAGLGGLIGVLFTIPLRRALVTGSALTFPEGVATAEVLKVGDEGGRGFLAILVGGLVGAIFKIGESGFRLWTGVLEGGRQVGNSIVYFGTNASPALLGVGYIVGLNIALLVFIGGAINWFVAIPIIAASGEWPEAMNATDYANELWSTRTRYIGVGAMVLGGLWALARLARSLVTGISASIAAHRAQRDGTDGDVPRTERDMPIKWVGVAIVLSVVPLFFVFNHITNDVGISVVMAVIMLIAGFLFSAVASYMAGLVGSSNNPISGVTIATLLTSALLLLALGMDSETGPAAAIMIGAVVCCAAAIGGDNMQDLKSGQLLGATPWKQQVMQVIGVVSAALVMAPVLSALLVAYGIGDVGGAEGQEALEAPQATLMASVAQGVFDQGLPWDMIGIGVAIAAVIIAVDLVLETKKASFRTPVLAVAVGIYLPLELATPVLLGGIVAHVAARFRGPGDSGRGGLLLAAGLITGEAMLGILLAVPLAAWEGENRFADWFAGVTNLASPLVWPGVVLMVLIAIVLGVVASRRD